MVKCNIDYASSNLVFKKNTSGDAIVELSVPQNTHR